jgi:hypothetical protein
MSALLTPQDAEYAVQLALNGIFLPMLRDGHINKPNLHIVVLRPDLMYGDCSFEEAILYEYSLQATQWEHDYQKYARAKAHLSWKHKEDGIIIQTAMPHLFAKGDTHYSGSVYRYNGFVAGASGVQGFNDMLMCAVVVEVLVAISKSKMDVIRKEEKVDFF